MELSPLSSGYSDVSCKEVEFHAHRIGGHSDDAVSSKTQVSSKLHYSDAGPHREMAVDCPPNFVGVKKEAPRPPRPLSNVIHTASPSSAFKSSQSSLSYPTGGSSLSVHSQQAIAPEPTDPVESASKFSFNRDERDRSERLRRYQEELAKRREMEDRINQEQEQLRASLRGSKKMQGLEEKRARVHMLEVRDGFDNPNYCADDGDDRILLKTVPLQSESKLMQQNDKDNHIVEHMNVQEVMMSVQQAKHYLHDVHDKADLGRVLHFLTNEHFQRVLKIHNKLVNVSLQIPARPDDRLAVTSLFDSVLRFATSSTSNNKYAKELVKILEDAHFKNLVYAYDKFVQHDVVPMKSVEDKDERECLYERASQYGDENIKIVRLQKTADPLGATVKNEGDAVIIGRIVKGGVAEKSGLLHEGDEILMINEEEIRGKTINYVCDLMSRLSGVLTFLINPGPEHGPHVVSDIVRHVRALFSYDPESDEDNLIPCHELGFSFKKCDILHIVNENDSNWWQAYREGEDDQILAGLIPSQRLHEIRENLRLMECGEQEDKKSQKFRCRCRKKKKKSSRADEEDVDAEKILSYEDVALYYPQPNRKRPIVLIGPPNVGRQELTQRLMEHDPDRFAAAVPHTSRPISDGELDGREYYFVPRRAFEAAVAEGQFVEYGEYEKQLFGTSMDAIRLVVNSGKVCVLNFHPQSMQILKKSDLKPYFIYIAPCKIAKLKQMCQKQGVSVTEEELEMIIDKGREMENNHGHLFDAVIVNQDLDKAFDELVKEINRLEVEPQWVPISWIT